MTDDSELTALAAKRTPAQLPNAQTAFAQLYDRHSRSLAAFLSSRVSRSEVDDVHQNVWARVWQALPEHYTGGHFRGWLFQIARNMLIDRSRRRRDEPAELDDHPGASSPPEAAILAREEQIILQRCMERLPADQLALVRGRLAGEDYETLGPRLKLPAARLHKLFFEAKTQLQNCVQAG